MKNLLLFLFLVTPVLALSQDVLENNPPSVKWSQISSPHFRIIFPRGFEDQGQRMANTLEHIREEEARSLGSIPRKISIVLQNQSAVSNGFVSILPRRSEFFAMPSQDYNFSGTNDWLDLLASHEYRHIVQYQHATRGFNRLLYYAFGATTLAGMASVAAPDWFWEGDAVVTETAFTPSGRGRIPNFSLVFKTNLMEGRTFNYHKQYLRSYRHNIPDHYVLGYHMVSYLRKRTNDPEIWGRITRRSWSVPFLPFAFSNAIKKESGLHVTDLYKELTKDLKKKWQDEISNLSLTAFSTTPVRRKKAYTDYLYPQAVDGGVLVLKKGIGDIEQFVLLSGDREKKVFIPGFINDSGMISANGSVVVWNEFGYDPRWNVRNYSLIKAYDLASRKKYVVGGKRSRYGSAAISPDQKKIVAVSTGTDYQTELRVLSFPDGKILSRLPNPDNIFFSMPRWSDDGKKIVVMKTSKGERSVAIVNEETMQVADEIKFYNENAGYPLLSGNYLIYNSPVTGIDNIFAVDISSGKRFQMTSSRYGAYNANVSPDGKTIYYNDQSRDGLNVVSIPFDPGSWKPVEERISFPSPYTHLVEQEAHPELFSTVPHQQFPVTKFSKLKSVINPYSWGFFVNNELTTANIGISSQDILSTTRIDAGYVFDITERTSSWRANVSYQALLPIIDISGSIANRSVTESLSDVQNVRFEWAEKNVKAGLRIPLVTTSSRFAGSLTVGNAVGLTHVSGFENDIDNGGRDVEGDLFLDYLGNGNLVFNESKFEAHRFLKRSRRDINSKWAQSLQVTHLTTPFGGDYQAGLFAITGVLYFPGFFKHHSLWTYGSFQDTKLILDKGDPYIFRNAIPLPRGQSVSRFLHFYTMAFNYTLPVWYPDIAIGPLLNIQRLRANGFYDYGIGISKTVDVTRHYSSIGVEAKVDINILRFLPQMDIGFRYTWAIERAEPNFEILLGTFNF